MFLAKAATLVVAIVIVLGAVAASGNRQRKSGKKGHIKVTHLNEHYDDLKDTLRHSVLEKEQLKQVYKSEKKQAKLEAKERAKSDKKRRSMETPLQTLSPASQHRGRNVSMCLLLPAI